MDAQLRELQDNAPTHTPDGRAAWTASILVPGWAQLIQFRPAAVLWLVACVAGYIWNWKVGLTLHNLCILDASLRQTRHKQARYYRD